MEAHAYNNKAGVSSDKAMYELLRNLSQVSGELHRRLGHSFMSKLASGSRMPQSLVFFQEISANDRKYTKSWRAWKLRSTFAIMLLSKSLTKRRTRASGPWSANPNHLAGWEIWEQCNLWRPNKWNGALPWICCENSEGVEGWIYQAVRELRGSMDYGKCINFSIQIARG